jgi:thymidylate synthase (FAD)
VEVILNWYAPDPPKDPDPDTCVAMVMRRTRDPNTLEDIVKDLKSQGDYCVECGKHLSEAGHDETKGDSKLHKVLPDWVVRLVRGAKKKGHFDVLEHPVYSFNIKDVSRVLTHQLVRHRLASYSQLSARYVATEDFVIPPLEEGYTLPDPVREELKDKMREALSSQWNLYGTLRDAHVKPEDARYVVGDGQTTSIIMTANARSLMHILRMRLARDAQWEIRDLANRMLALVRPTAPILWEEPFPEGI